MSSHLTKLLLYVSTVLIWKIAIRIGREEVSAVNLYVVTLCHDNGPMMLSSLVINNNHSVAGFILSFLLTWYGSYRLEDVSWIEQVFQHKFLWCFSYNCLPKFSYFKPEDSYLYRIPPQRERFLEVMGEEEWDSTLSV